MDKRQKKLLDALYKDINKTKATKKNVYKPNLNCVRNKGTTLKSTDGKEYGKRSSSKAKKSRDPPDKYKQSDSVFSEGVGEMKYMTLRVKGRKIYDSTQRCTSETSSSVYSDHKLDDSFILNELSGCKKETIDPEVNCEPVELEKLYRGSLGTSSASALRKGLRDMQIEIDANVKHEDDHSTLPFMDEKMHSVNFPSLNVIKLPNLLPSQSYNETKSNCKNKCSMCSIPQDKIGKVYIRKSGKMEALIGNMRYKLHEVTEFVDKYDVVTFIKNDNGGKSELVVLGQTEKWFSLVPDWYSLLTVK